MLEIMNVGSTDLSCKREDNTILLNCWDKSSPLIKELQQTVNFAERKCGDLMQQLNFYKEYYEKWAHTERLNNLYQKKKLKKNCRQALNAGSSSENEFEKVNEYFYKKIKNKIIEMNNEITQANRKLSSKNENFTCSLLEDDLTTKSKQNFQTLENKTCKSEPLMTVTKPELQKQNQSSCDNNQLEKNKINKLSETQSIKTIPARNKILKKKDFVFVKRRYSNLQRYKIRSKSLPQGVRRKFGFGGFFEVHDSDVKHNESVKDHSKTSIKSESLKNRKSEGKSKLRLAEPNTKIYYKFKTNKPRSARSLHYRLSKTKLDVRPNSYHERNNFSKEWRNCDSAVDVKKVPQHDVILQKKAISQNFQKVDNFDSCKISEASHKDKTIDTKSTPFLQTTLNQIISKPNSLIPFLRTPIPFIPCSSTSKTFNLGLNIQQVLSLIKHKKHSVTLQAVIRNGMQAAGSLTQKTEPIVNTFFLSETSHSHVSSLLCPARQGSEYSFSAMTDNVSCRTKCSILKQVETTQSQVIDSDTKQDHLEINKLQRPEDVWVVEQPDNTSKGFKKIRTRCTCFPSKHCVDYHKVLRQYTGWRMPGARSESFASETHSSYNPTDACMTPKLYAIPSREIIDFNSKENNGRIELIKVHNDLINLNRKYSTLQEQISENSLDDYEANAELDAMESELAVREVEFKDILNIYNQISAGVQHTNIFKTFWDFIPRQRIAKDFMLMMPTVSKLAKRPKLMLLKEKLKSLRLRGGQNQTAIHQLHYQRPKKDPLRPTPSMALTKVLRKIQGLQDKIKLIDAP